MSQNNNLNNSQNEAESRFDNKPDSKADQNSTRNSTEDVESEDRATNGINYDYDWNTEYGDGDIPDVDEPM